VKVVHGDLAYARFPVMAGHYAGDPILHAEKALDRSIGGILSKRLQLDLYPRAIGSHEIVITPSKAGVTGKGALVVGLGDVGDLTPGGLSATVEAAVVRYSTMNTQEKRLTASGGLGLSSLLIGSGETGLSLEQVIESILQGVRVANQRLSNAATDSTLVTDIEFVEIYEDVAIEALHVLREMEGTPTCNCRIATDLERSDGGRRRAAYSGNPGWWTPLAIESDQKAGVLNFEAGGKRARVASETIHVQKELIEQMLQRPLSSEGANKLLRQTLFELLLPRVLKLRASDNNNLLLVVDDQSAQYPWEMLVDRLSAEGNPLSVQAGLVRKLKVKSPPQVVHPESKTALVVGDPPSAAAPLPGAETEAIEVANRLAESWDVTRQIRHDPDSRKSTGQSDIDARSIMGAALTGDYRILHLAGHGIYDPDDPTRSGMVIGDHRKRGEFVLLSPAEVAQMRCMPELVFINCCHLGRIESTPQHLLAANLATEFIKNGVKAVVAAGWAVDDNPALCFAGTFYEQMFQGRNFGDAVMKARKVTYDRYRDSNTWAAYQCYGDPGFSLMMDTGVRQKATTGRWDGYVDPQEIIMELDNLHSWLQTQKGESNNFESTAADLQELYWMVTRRNWHSDGRILTRMARVYSDIKQFDEATRIYEMAKSTESGEVTLRDLEQLANMRARHAESTAKSDPSKRRAAIRDIQLSMDELDTLLKLAPTSERWALKGSTSKRIVTTRGDVSLTTGLKEMTAAYTEAALCDRRNLYPLLNALAGLLLLGGPWKTVPRSYSGNPFAGEREFDAALKAASKLAPVLATEQLNFWTQTYGPDCRLLTALRANNLDRKLDKIRARYVSLLDNFGSAGERDSVTTQLEFLENCLRWTPRGNKNASVREKQADQLKRLRESLSVPAGDDQ
jgi:CHAT domain-containing protein